MHIYNNKVRFFAQALVVETSKAVANATVVSAKATSGLTQAAVVSTKVVRSERKAVKEAKAFAKQHNLAQGIK